MLTENGKKWLAKHAGINGCFSDHGVKIIDPVKGVSEELDTSAALAGFFVMQTLGGIYKFLSILEDGSCYYDFYKANGYNTITTDDIKWVMDHESGANRYCITPEQPQPQLPEVITAEYIMKLVKAKLGLIDLGFPVTAALIMEAVKRKVQQKSSLLFKTVEITKPKPKIVSRYYALLSKLLKEGGKNVN